MKAIDGKYEKVKLLTVLEQCYRFWAKEQDSELTKVGVKLPEAVNKRWILNKLLEEEPNEQNMLAAAQRSNLKTTDFVVSLKQA